MNPQIAAVNEKLRELLEAFEVLVCKDRISLLECQTCPLADVVPFTHSTLCGILINLLQLIPNKEEK